jgi:SAM-dependent methyltransferase
MSKRGWFTTPGRAGDRTLSQQLTGLEPALEFARDRRVLDIGCAEGLLSMEMARAGATHVTGVDIVADHIRVAHELCPDDFPCNFFVADANVYRPRGRFDLVLLLAILHKLRDPAAACQRFIGHCDDMVAIRLPPAFAPLVVDPRSYNVPHDIDAVMRKNRFALQEVRAGHLNEWLGIYRKRP